MQFEQTRQFKNWIFDSTSLANLRNGVATQALNRYSLQLHEQSPSLPVQQTQLQASQEVLTQAEEATVINHLSKQMLYEWDKVIARDSKIPAIHMDVKATALTFFKRFYIANTIMDYSPQKILAVCFNLAAKVEERWELSVDSKYYPRITRQLTHQKRDVVVHSEVSLLSHPYHHFIPLGLLSFKPNLFRTKSTLYVCTT